MSIDLPSLFIMFLIVPLYCLPPRLMNIVTLGMDKEAEGGHRQLNKTEQLLGPGIDLEFETEMSGTVPEPEPGEQPIRVEYLVSRDPR